MTIERFYLLGSGLFNDELGPNGPNGYPVRRPTPGHSVPEHPVYTWYDPRFKGFKLNWTGVVTVTMSLDYIPVQEWQTVAVHHNKVSNPGEDYRKGAIEKASNTEYDTYDPVVVSATWSLEDLSEYPGLPSCISMEPDHKTGYATGDWDKLNLSNCWIEFDIKDGE